MGSVIINPHESPFVMLKSLVFTFLFGRHRRLCAAEGSAPGRGERGVGLCQLPDRAAVEGALGRVSNLKYEYRLLLY